MRFCTNSIWPSAPMDSQSIWGSVQTSSGQVLLWTVRVHEVLYKLHLAKCSYGQSEYMRFCTNFIWLGQRSAKCSYGQSDYVRFWTVFIWPSAPMDSQSIWGFGQTLSGLARDQLSALMDSQIIWGFGRTSSSQVLLRTAPELRIPWNVSNLSC